MVNAVALIGVVLWIAAVGILMIIVRSSLKTSLLPLKPRVRQ